MSEEIKEFIEIDYRFRMELMLEQAIRIKFPLIKNLSIAHSESKIISIQFEEGEYSEKEVESFITQLRNYDPR